MKLSRFRIPKTVPLPGVKIPVKQLPDAEMTHDGVLCDGWWDYDVDKGTCCIHIRKSLPICQKRYAIWHELQHVVTDGLDVGINFFPHIMRHP